jgi:Protein of unknown function (DUF1761)
MTFDAWNDLNWLAMIVAALAYFAIGAVWYAPPVFGAMWMAAGGMTRDQTEGGPGAAVFAVPLIGSLLSALALAMLAVASGTDTLSEGIVLGFIMAIGFALAISLVTATFESTKPKPMLWGAVNAGYHIVGTVVAGAIIGGWR